MKIITDARGVSSLNITKDELVNAGNDPALYNIAFDIVQAAPHGATAIGVIAVLLSALKKSSPQLFLLT